MVLEQLPGRRNSQAAGDRRWAARSRPASRQTPSTRAALRARNACVDNVTALALQTFLESASKLAATVGNYEFNAGLPQFISGHSDGRQETVAVLSPQHAPSQEFRAQLPELFSIRQCEPIWSWVHGATSAAMAGG